MPARDVESREAIQRLKGPSGIISGNGVEVEGRGVARCPGGWAQHGHGGSVAVVAQTASQTHCSSNGLEQAFAILGSCLCPSC